MRLCKPFKEFKYPQSITQGYHAEHLAIDAVAYYGAPLLAQADGIIEEIITPNQLLDETDNEHIRRGYGVVVRYENGLKTIYWHCQPIFPVEIGQKVKQGEIVGYMGNSGFVKSGGAYVPVPIRTNKPYKGTHVHWENWDGQKYINPVLLVDWNLETEIDLSYMQRFLSKARISLIKMQNLLKGR